MKDINEIKRILQENKNLFYENYGVRILGIFGSYARDSATEESDLDLLVDFEKPQGFKIMNVWDSLENLVGVKVDLASVKYLRPRLRALIEKELVYV